MCSAPDVWVRGVGGRGEYYEYSRKGRRGNPDGPKYACSGMVLRGVQARVIRSSCGCVSEGVFESSAAASKREMCSVFLSLVLQSRPAFTRGCKCQKRVCRVVETACVKTSVYIQVGQLD